MINNRIFGSNIPKEVAKKLNERQSSVGEIEFGESVKIPKDTEFSSRTPFVRMWTSVKLIEPGVVAENLKTVEEEVYIQGDDTYADGEFEIDASNVSGAQWLAKSYYNQIKHKYPDAVVVPIYDKDDKTIIKYAVKETGMKSGGREQIDYVSQIYEIGNHRYQENYGEASPNEPLVLTKTDGTTITSNSPFTNESEKNPLLKPQSGITSVSSDTDGALGVIKKTTVNFIVHNFYDFDIIYNKYFLRPGAQIFVDFGWSSIKNLYKPEELIKASTSEIGGVQDFLYSTEANNKGIITKEQGDLEVIQGIVTDYNSKILPNGSVECSVTLTSSNSALMSFKTEDNIVHRVKQLLTRGILYLGLRSIIKASADAFKASDGEKYDGFMKDIAEITNTPSVNKWTATDFATYENNLKLLAAKELSGASGPQPQSSLTGVFVSSIDADDTYITWGLFEDLIINSQFGFGKSQEDILDGSNLQVKLDSSNSFTKYNKFHLEKQHILFKVPEESPIFLYPAIWGAMTPDAGSYSYQVKKYPIQDYIKKYPDFNESFEGEFEYSSANLKNNELWKKWSDFIGKSGNQPLKDDKIKYERIPIREVFINTDIIVKAFEQNDNVKKVIEQIIDEINKGSDGLFDWKLISGGTDSEILLVDKNYTNVEMFKSVEEEYEDIFQFNVMTPNSLIKDYNLEFKLPSGNIGNMYAIQGMSHGSSLFSVDNDVDNALATVAIDNDALSVIYEPDNGSYRLEQLLDRKNDSEAYDVYSDVNKIISSNIYKVTPQPRNYNILDKPLKDSNSVNLDYLVTKGKTTEDIKEIIEDVEKPSSVDLVNQVDEMAQIMGYKVANNFTEYYEMRIVKEGMHKHKANLLPYNLTLTMYGIASIQPGDIFRVNYLPKKYQENTFLQTIKVSHAIGSGGWYTTLEAKFRLKPENKAEYYDIQDRAKVVLSANALTVLGLEQKIQINTATFWSGGAADDYFPFDALSGYMENIKIDYKRDSRIDMMLNFTLSKKLSEFIGSGDGIIQNEEGNFGAIFDLRHQGNQSYENMDLKPGWHVDHTHAGSDDLVLNKDTSFNLAEGLEKGVVIKPRDCKLIPGKNYSLWIRDSAWCIMERDYENYEKVKEYFMKYVGYNQPPLGEQTRFGASEAIIGAANVVTTSIGGVVQKLYKYIFG